VTCRKIAGPHICGDALDVDPVNNQVLTGSWRRDNALQVDALQQLVHSDVYWRRLGENPVDWLLMLTKVWTTRG